MLAYVDDKDVEKRQVREKRATTTAAQAVFTKFCFPVEFVVSLDTKAFFFYLNLSLNINIRDRGFDGRVCVGVGLCVTPMSCVLIFRRGGRSLRPTW